MPLDRMPSISLGIIIHVGALYHASYHWHTEAGEPRASVGFDAGGHSNAHIQGPRPPCGSWPPPSSPPPTGPRAPTILSMPLWWWRRRWPADVGRQPRLPSLRLRLAQPLPVARTGR
jgi:hypothetical protein